RVSVIDTGIGIAPQDIARLGEPFVQLDSGSERAFAGTGLGLSVVRGLVSLHDGSFDVTSREGEGTTIALSLPLIATQPAAEPDARIVPGDAGVVAIARIPAEEEAQLLPNKPSRVDEGDDYVRLQA
ncbi:MAG: ATP-binding protein, partial [Pseudomonadota bacterium]